MRKRTNFKLILLLFFLSLDMSGSFLRFSWTTYLTLDVRGVLTSPPSPMQVANCEAMFVIFRHIQLARFHVSLRLTLPVFGWCPSRFPLPPFRFPDSARMPAIFSYNWRPFSRAVIFSAVRPLGVRAISAPKCKVRIFFKKTKQSRSKNVNNSCKKFI